MTIPGWYTSRPTYNADNGGSGTGALYSYGSTGSTDRALGDVGSGTTGNILAGVRLVNNTGATITSLDISFVGEQWRNGGSATTGVLSVAQTVDFQYQVANPGVVTDANAPLTAGWVDYNPLDFTSPKFGTNAAAALDGNLAANRVPLSSTLAVTVNPGQEIWLRWLDINHADNDHGLAIDDFSVTANGAGATNPSGVGAASPNSVTPGGTTLLTVAATGGTSPVSSGLAVSANLTSIGGAAGQTFYDDGSHGDVTANDKTFSFSATVANGTTGGAKSLPFSVTDAQSRSGGGNIALTVVTPTNPSGTGAASPSTVQAGSATLLTVAVTPGANPTSTGLTVTGDLSSIGGSATQQFFDNGSNGDATANDNTFSYGATVPASTASGIKTLPVQIADAQARTASTSISLSVQDAPVPAGALVISQIYGGGGNSGADYKNDFIEIFNRSTQAVNLSGWSVQYGSSGGTSWQRTPLTNFILQPGQYYLVQESAGTGGTLDLPTPDATGTITMSATAAKIALVRNNVNLSGTTCSEWLGDPDLVDFVGYGTASNCFAGTGPAPTLSATTAALRTRNGCKDTDADNLDFVERAPAPRNSASSSNVCPVGDLPPEVYSTDPAAGGTNFPLAGNINVTFDTAVNVTDGGFTLSCSTSGVHTLAVTGGPTSFTLNPDTDLVSGETCTASVLASHVSSQATTPVPMAADYTWTFTALVVRDPSEHMVMGNPSGAVTDVGTPLNYLMMKPQYALSYNDDKGTANWTSWHLDSTWTTGVSDRQNDFRPDDTLPASFKHVQSGYNFATYGFDRGHMTPSADRTSSVADNSATFLMTNMVPQASGNNQGPWASLENHIRTLLNGSANEIYILSGGFGTGGNSSTGHWDTIQDTGGNTVNVPQLTWKVVMVMPRANGDDVARVNTSTRTFAVIMPNNDNIRPDDWKKYLATVDQVEALTGYNFYSNVPEAIQNVIEAQLDAEYDTAPVADNQSVSTAEDTAKAITLTATDFNVNNTFTYTVLNQPAHGQLTVANNAVTYTPFADYNGPDSFTFKANDGNKDSNVATISINVTPVNDAPVANDDTFNTSEDAAAADVNVLGNDTDIEGDALAVTVVGAAAHGTATLVGGVVKYAPAANYNGSDSFTYTVSDGHGGTATGTVNVNVSGVNDNPVANADAATTDEDTAVSVNVVGNDADVDGDGLSVTAVTQGAHGTVSFAGGSVTYTPAPNYNGADSFGYTVGDGQGGSASANVTVTVNAVNDGPVAANDSATVAEDSGANTVSVLGNDSDVDNDTLAVTAFTQGAHGTVANNGGSVSYTPNPNYNGPDSFGYTVSDGHGGTATATVSVNVTAVNDNPVANADTATTDEDTAVSVEVVFNDNDVDGDTLSLESVDGATHGSVAVVGGQAVFTPAANYHGPASFTYVVSDGNGGTATGTVGVTVNPVNDNPVAAADEATTNEDSPVNVNVLSNDSDVDGDTLSVTNAGGATKGSVAFTAGGVTYTPNSNANGTDSFSYTVSDGNGGTATATVNVTINPVNDAPTVSNIPAATVAELSAYTFTASAADVDGDTLTFSLVGAPANATINPATGEFNWTPNEAQGGTGTPFTFTVRVSDGTSNADAAVSITVTEVNQAPTLAPIAGQAIFLGGTVSFAASGADADLPAQTLTYSLTGAPAGAAINPATGAFSWTPTAAQAGQTYTFVVRVTDNGPGQLSAEQPVTVGVGHTWSGFLQPINQNGSSVFKLGQTVPVKFQLTGAGAGVTNAVARLYVAKVTDSVVGTEEAAGSTSNATEGNLFRYADGQYVFNLSTKGLTTGTYQLRVDLGDGVPRVVIISLR